VRVARADSTRAHGGPALTAPARAMGHPPTG
jgi:hypothetical protein